MRSFGCQIDQRHPDNHQRNAYQCRDRKFFVPDQVTNQRNRRGA